MYVAKSNCTVFEIGSYYLIWSMSVVPAVLIVLVGENVTIKSRSIASGMTTGTIGTTAMKNK